MNEKSRWAKMKYITDCAKLFYHVCFNAHMIAMCGVPVTVVFHNEPVERETLCDVLATALKDSDDDITEPEDSYVAHTYDVGDYGFEVTFKLRSTVDV
jgi:hypothetical protein